MRYEVQKRKEDGWNKLVNPYTTVEPGQNVHAKCYCRSFISLAKPISYLDTTVSIIFCFVFLLLLHTADFFYKSV